MTSTATFSLDNLPKQLDQDEVNEILDQAKVGNCEWHEAMVNANIEIFEIFYQESVSYLKLLEKITHVNSPATLPVDNRSYKSVTSRVGKSSKKPKASKKWCHYIDKNNNNAADCRTIAKFKQLKKARLEVKSGPVMKCLVLLFKRINALKRQWKPKKTANKNKRKAESLLSTEINVTTSSDF
jgi:hypothetical protein